MKKLRFKTIILSDIHLGTIDCKVEEVNFLLKNSRCERLILNGDIIDGWQLRKGGRWANDHSRFIRLVLKHIEKNDTEVIYTRGNHDDILARFLPLDFANLQIREEYILECARGRYLVLHGDVFDVVTTRLRFLAHIGDIGYQWLLWLNRIYNRWLAWRGRDFFSLSKTIKAKVKSAVSYISHYESQLVDMARNKNCQGVICGHIHMAANKRIDDIHYLNSGDWVESLTAIVEHYDGGFEVLDYKEFQRRLEQRNRQRSPVEQTTGGIAPTVVPFVGRPNHAAKPFAGPKKNRWRRRPDRRIARAEMAK